MRDTTPKHGEIQGYYARVYDANIRDWVFVPCDRDDLLRQAVTLP
ncbi:hypothetical protein ANRL2_00902 [Anaerolineae bacterium]|nr:hypothetical protein ANRL2_00902 [Anaerolineae bacterium]